MAAAGKPMDNLDVISHILSGLDHEMDGASNHRFDKGRKECESQ
jgi:hypothetical protein